MPFSFRLMTVNLLQERGDPLSFADLVGRVSPDVLVTQELSHACAEIVAGSYPYHRLRPADDFTGRGIASRLEAKFGDIPMPARYGTWALLNASDRLIRLAGMHLVNPIEFPWWRSVRRRRGQLEALFRWADSADDSFPLIAAGDFNASPIWPAYRDITRRWDDLVADRASASGVKPEATWAWRPRWPRMLRIDHVFGTAVRATSVAVHPVSGSDHHAVVADLELTGYADLPPGH